MNDDCKRSDKSFKLIDSSSYIIITRKDCSKGHDLKSDPLSDIIQATEAEPVEPMAAKVPLMSPVLRKSVASVEHQASSPIRISFEPYCQVKVDSLNKLKESTKKLLRLLDDIQSKTYSKDLPPFDTNDLELASSKTEWIEKASFTSDIAKPALRNLEAQTQELYNIYIEDEYDDCSVFKRLTRKCLCLNQQEYNDFIIHFNENTKYFTSTSGEIIKNLRILKKFLYMGGSYTKNALIFLNEGLEKSSYTEKVQIAHGCSHSDICNVFDDHSVVILCIFWPCKFPFYGDNITQNLAASLLYKLAKLEEGRRYLKYTTKITNDIKKVLRKCGAKLDVETADTLQAALNLIHPPMTQNDNFTYSPQNDEGFVTENIFALQHFRKCMTLSEVFKHLYSLANYSYKVKGKTDLTLQLPSLLLLFKQMLKEYDNSEINIMITNILNNIVVRNKLKQKQLDEPKTITMTETATEPVMMKNVKIQMPQEQTNTKKSNKSKLKLGSKLCQPLRRKEYLNRSYINRSRKLSKYHGEVIVIPYKRR